MPKAKTINRLELTRRNSKFLQAVQELKKEEGITSVPENEICPVCGAKLLHIAGCLECPNKDYSVCG